MHGLIFETSVCYWQNQPGCYLSISFRSLGRNKANPVKKKETTSTSIKEDFFAARLCVPPYYQQSHLSQRDGTLVIVSSSRSGRYRFRHRSKNQRLCLPIAGYRMVVYYKVVVHSSGSHNLLMTKNYVITDTPFYHFRFPY